MAASSLLVAGSTPDEVRATAPSYDFQFFRLVYSGGGGFGGFGFGRGGSAWDTDAPEAEMHFLQGLQRLSRVAADERAVYLPPDDPRIFDHPWMYAVEVGRWSLSDEDAAQLREYLLRGGFLMVDDFHGSFQWETFMESMRRVFPDREVVEIPDDHEVFHVAYDLGGPVTPFNVALNQNASTGGHRKIQIPGIGSVMRGMTYEGDGVVPHWRGIFDDDGRLMVAINFNMDMGDAWEHADTPQYPQMLTALAYRFGVNYVLYSMTH